MVERQPLDGWSWINLPVIHNPYNRREKEL